MTGTGTRAVRCSASELTQRGTNRAFADAASACAENLRICNDGYLAVQHFCPKWTFKRAHRSEFQTDLSLQSVRTVKTRTKLALKLHPTHARS